MTSDDIALARLNRSLGDKLRAEARRRGVAADAIRKQYVFTLFLGRIFSAEERPGWVLLGGNALLIRTGGGRFTQDIDLAREGELGSPSALRAEIQSLTDADAGRDPFTFVVESVTPHSEPDPYGYGTRTAKAKVIVLLGNAAFERFSIDLTERRHLDAAVDDVPLRPVIDHETLTSLPTVPTTPWENHLADKICALYEQHETGPSTRYRDLADVVRIIHAAPLDASRLALVLRREAGRRALALPAAMVVPAETWHAAFPRQARTFAEYPAELFPLEVSLSVAGACLDELLSGGRTTGVWDPVAQCWLG